MVYFGIFVWLIFSTLVDITEQLKEQNSVLKNWFEREKTINVRLLQHILVIIIIQQSGSFLQEGEVHFVIELIEQTGQDN